MGRALPRRGIATGASAGVAAVAITLSACAPAGPPAYSTPSARPVAVPTDASADGFTVGERLALRVFSPTCDAFRNGSAWMLDETHAVTNRHVAEGATGYTLTDYQGRSYAVAEAVLSTEDDLALLTIDGTFPRTATLADDEPVPGDLLTMSGFAAGGPLATRAGPLVAVAEDSLDPEGALIYGVRIVAREGDSGSALLDADNRVVGVVFSSDGDDDAGAVTLPRLRAFLDGETGREPMVADC